MRWSIVRLIWLREMRDQLRDRRTMLMIFVLPLLIYPLGGIGLMQIMSGLTQQKTVIGVIGAADLPRADAGPKNDKDRPYPPLLTPKGKSIQFVPEYFDNAFDLVTAEVVLLDPPPGVDPPPPTPDEAYFKPLRRPLDERKVDVLLIVGAGFAGELEEPKGSPSLYVLSRPDEASARAKEVLRGVLRRWHEAVKKVRFQRLRLAPEVDRPFEVHDPDSARAATRKSDELLVMLVRLFPFILVLWSLAGALYPAVDLCAGEKERGTMETLLISPAQREEIVWGKFLAIWVFSALTAFLNLFSMGVTTWVFTRNLGIGEFNPFGLFWCLVLLLPLSAFFSALALAIGAYARSTKEGQYYLMPLFLVTMPLMFLTMVPGVELNPFYSMVPVTGVSLLIQKLMIVGTPDPALWLYFVPVLVPMVIYSWLALRWAIIQFQREEVLFRESERLDILLWFRRFLREKEPRPSTGQALFCFIVILGLSWFSLGLGTELLATNVIRFLAFVATPSLLMALLLTTQPRQSLALRLPPSWAWPVALALAVGLTPVLIELTLLVLRVNPNLAGMLEQYRPATMWLESLSDGGASDSGAVWKALIVFAWLPALCEELAFRGFILTGLQRRFRPRTAVLLSSFLFALIHMNVFLFIPTFLLGVVLAYLTTRCGSILPAILFHLAYNTLLLRLVRLGPDNGEPYEVFGLSRWLVVGVCLPVAAGLLWWMTKLWPHPEYVAFLQSDPGMEKPLSAQAGEPTAAHEVAS
jgi:sodium transport system permease protein